MRSSLGVPPWAVRYSMEARVVGSMRMRVTMADHVQGSVEAPVAAIVESVTHGVAAGGGDRADAGEVGEGGFGAYSSWM